MHDRAESSSCLAMLLQRYDGTGSVQLPGFFPSIDSSSRVNAVELQH
jgi:hypothetical protein